MQGYSIAKSVPRNPGGESVAGREFFHAVKPCRQRIADLRGVSLPFRGGGLGWGKFRVEGILSRRDVPPFI